METVQIEAARRALGEIVDRARLAGEPTMILRNRTPAAVLVPVDWYHDAAAALGRTPQTAVLVSGVWYDSVTAAQGAARPVPAGDIAERCDDCGANLVQGQGHRPGCVLDGPGPE